MSDYYYKYPADSSVLEEIIKDRYKKIEKKKRAFAIISAELLILLLMYFLPVFEKISSVFLVLFVLQIVFLFFYLKEKNKQQPNSFTAITAYDDRMIIDYYINNLKKTLEVSYESITDARFSDPQFTRFQITFIPSEHDRIYEKNIITGEENTPSLANLFLFSVAPESYEQYFFLYIAEEHFTVKGLKKTNKYFKKFGNKNEYLVPPQQPVISKTSLF